MSLTIRKALKSLPVLGLALALSACADQPADTGSNIPFPTPPAATADLDQGWTAGEAEAWWTVSQGSRLVPLAWLRALEQPTSAKPFLDNDYIARFRYIPGLGAADPVTKTRLPLGFAIDASDSKGYQFTNLKWKAGQGDNEPWVGLTCSACHSNEISYKGSRMLVEGAPTLADFQSFIEAFNESLKATLTDPVKFERFALAVLGHPDSDGKLRNALQSLSDWEQTIVQANATPLRYGFGRLDAFGNIFNKVALSVHATSPTRLHSDAPVSYPFMWNVPQHDKVQWNGIAPKLMVGPDKKFDLGAVLRNVGEVVGVFGDVNVKPYKGKLEALGGYPNSADIDGVVALEDLLTRLRPPKWPSQLFGEINSTKAKRGEVLYGQYCASCHTPLDRTNISTPFNVVMSQFNGESVQGGNVILNKTAPGTDPMMACNAVLDAAATGVLLGTPKISVSALAGGKSKPEKFGPVAASADMLTGTVGGIILNKKGELVAEIFKSLFEGPEPGTTTASAEAIAGQPTVNPELPLDRNKRVALCRKLVASGNVTANSLLAYKGRPLTGIWATAPYLHNGSVPTLWDLLLPVAQRPAQFNLGSREFDPVKVGFVTAPSSDNSFTFRARMPDGKAILGNDNAGHEFGTRLSNADRWALIEYMKGL